VYGEVQKTRQEEIGWEKVLERGEEREDIEAVEAHVQR